MSKQFSDVAKISRETAKQPRVKMDSKVTSFLTEFNPLLPDLNNKLKIAFKDKSIKAIYER